MKTLKRETEIWADRYRKLEAARELRRKSRELDRLYLTRIVKST